jgi:hypothetical protein
LRGKEAYFNQHLSIYIFKNFSMKNETYENVCQPQLCTAGELATIDRSLRG